MSNNIQPYTSPYAPPLSDSGPSGNIPSNAAVPDLAMVWTTAPGIAGTQASKSSKSSHSGSPKNYSSEFKLDFGAVQDALNSILLAASTIVQAYETLKGEFENVKDTVFGQTATITQEIVQVSGPMNTWGTETYPDPMQQQAQQFANGANGQPGMNDAQAWTLQSVGNAMAILGQFIVLAHLTAVSYANADFNSILPPVNVSHKG